MKSINNQTKIGKWQAAAKPKKLLCQSQRDKRNIFIPIMAKLSQVQAFSISVVQYRVKFRKMVGD